MYIRHIRDTRITTDRAHLSVVRWHRRGNRWQTDKRREYNARDKARYPSTYKRRAIWIPRGARESSHELRIHTILGSTLYVFVPSLFRGTKTMVNYFGYIPKVYPSSESADTGMPMNRHFIGPQCNVLKDEH
jgi:hypothetical protein